MLDTMLSADITTSLQTINDIKTKKGLALADILSSLSEELGRISVPSQTRVTWLEGLAEIEWRVGTGGSENIQTGALAGVVRKGVQLMDRESKV